MDQRRRNRKGDGERLRAELVRATSGLLAESGDARSLSIRAIVQAVGVTPPSLYLHFPTKEALLREVIELRFRAFEAYLDASVGDADGFEALERRCHAYVAYGLEHPGHYRVLFSTLHTGPGGLGTDGVAVHPGAASYLALVEAVRACFLGTRAPAGLIENHSLVVWGGLHGIVDLRITKPEMPWPRTGPLVDLIVAGVRSGVERRRRAPRSASA